MTTYYTCNVDFGKKNPAEVDSIKSIEKDLDIGFFQEVKHLNVRRALGKWFAVHQSLKTRAMQGTAIAWRHGQGIRRHKVEFKNKRRIRDRGYIVGVLNLGFRMLPRYINWRDLSVNGVVVRHIATHRPPQRYRRLWTLFDRTLAAFVKRSPYPIIIGMDSNEHYHAHFEKQANLVWHGIGIDGFYLSPVLEKYVVKGSLKAHPKAKSDHHPISLELDFTR